MSAFQKELNELVARIRATENEKNLAEQKIAFIRQNKQNLGLQISKANERLAKLHEEIVALRSQHDEQSVSL